MAMHYPHPRVVCAEGDGDVPAKWEESDVAARWVLVSEDGRVARVGERIVRPVLLGEQEEIVAVEVDWVGERDEGAVWEEVGRVAWLAFNYEVDPGVGGWLAKTRAVWGVKVVFSRLLMVGLAKSRYMVWFVRDQRKKVLFGTVWLLPCQREAP